MKEVFWMNNKGQSLITFVLLLPIVIFLIAYILDSASGYLEKSKLDGSVANNLKIILNNNLRDVEEIQKVLKENEPNADIYVIIKEDKIKIDVKLLRKGFFQNNKLELSYCGDYQDKEMNKCG